MAYIRFRLDLAIPKDVYDSIPSATKLAIRDKIRQLKTYARKINEGSDNEEMTITAKYHVCRHDEGLSCDAEIDV